MGKKSLVQLHSFIHSARSPDFGDADWWDKVKRPADKVRVTLKPDVHEHQIIIKQ